MVWKNTELHCIVLCYIASHSYSYHQPVKRLLQPSQGQRCTLVQSATRREIEDWNFYQPVGINHDTNSDVQFIWQLWKHHWQLHYHRHQFPSRDAIYMSNYNDIITAYWKFLGMKCLLKIMNSLAIPCLQFSQKYIWKNLIFFGS